MTMSYSPTLPFAGAHLGPESRYRQLRTLVAYATLLVAGTFLANVAENPGIRAFGLGLVAPGGGFLVYATGDTWAVWTHVALFATTLVLFAASLIAWFGAGAVIAPPIVWLGSAIAALGMNHPHIHGAGTGVFLWLPAVLAGGLAVGLAGLRATKGPRTAPHRPPEPRVKAQTATATDAEIPAETLSRLRFVLDRALQPVEHFNGFQWIDQFQPAAMRYQLTFAGFASALTQRRLPAFRGGYLHEAQRRLIEKQRDWRVWRYWRLENAWGNLRWDADPIPRDNIMYSGFVAAQIACFQSVTGDMRYARTGAFGLQKPGGQTFEHDFTTMTDALIRGWRTSPYGLMPCEPNWVYPMCNAIGAGALVARDAQCASRLWPGISDRFRHGLDTELTTRSGRLVAFRSVLTGFAPPAIGGAAADATPALFFNATFPDVSTRLMDLLRRDAILPDGTLNRRALWRIDTGDYRRSRAASYTAVAAAAAELGDPALAAQTLRMLEEECPSVHDAGVTHRQNASVFAHFVELMALMGGPDALRSILREPRRHTPGPWLAAARYPDVLVARADWDRGTRLRLVLHPGSDPRGDPGQQQLTLAGFDPGAQFRYSGSAAGTGTADRDGRASITVALTGRTEVLVEPIR